MSETKQMRIIALVMLVGAVAFAVLFVASGFSVIWILPCAASIVGSFTALLLSVAS